jgi:CBS domain-containing protein
MTQRRIRHLPVKDGDQLVGIISIGDVLKHRLGEVELEVNVLATTPSLLDVSGRVG